MKICIIEDCNNKHHGKGLCKLHYNKTKQHINYNKCVIEDCINIVGTGAKGYCAKHYARLKRTGDPLKTSRLRDNFSLVDFIENISEKDINSFVIKNRPQWAYAAKLYYGDKCIICGWNETTCDANHIVSVKDGGKNFISNAEILCPNCHAKKHRGIPLNKRKWISKGIKSLSIHFFYSRSNDFINSRTVYLFINYFYFQ